MKKLFFLAAAVLLSSALQARTWRINNAPEAKADFTSINEAMASADVVGGDVLYLDPGCHLPSQTINKSVTIIGNGFNLRSDEMESSINGVRIQCKDVVMKGVNINGSYEATNTNYTGLVIERCKVGNITSYGPLAHIASCYITGTVAGAGGSNGSLRLYNNIILGNVCQINYGVIRNNIIIYNPNSTYTDYYYYCLYGVENSTIIDNIILNTNTRTSVDGNGQTVTYNHQTIHNNSASYGNDIKHNIFSNDANHVFADCPSNSYIGAKVADVFVNEGAWDEPYQLKEDSPAKGAGLTGNDCGPFDGMYPYVMSCRPRNIPYIYEATVPSRPTNNKITVTVKAKNQGE